MKKILFFLLVLLGVISFSSCEKDDPTPVSPPTPKETLKLSLSELTLALYETQSVTISGAKEVSMSSLPEVSTELSGTVLKVTLNKVISTEKTLEIISGKQKLPLKIKMAPVQQVAAPLGVFTSSGKEAFKVVYNTKKLSGQKLEYFLISDQKNAPLSHALQVFPANLNGTTAHFKVKVFGQFLGTDQQQLLPQGEQNLQGEVLFSINEKVQIRTKLPSGVIWDFVIPK